MMVVVSSKSMAEFLHVQINNCTTYFLHLNQIKKKLYIKTDQDDESEVGEYIYIDSFRNAEDVELTGDQLRGLKRFLKAIPHQPIVIKFENDEKIKCTSFIAEF